MMMNDDDLTFQEARDEYIRATRENLGSNLKKRNLYDVNSRCYIVSNNSLHDVVKSVEATPDGATPTRKRNQEAYIDEEQLLVDILETAVKRRYPSRPKT